MQGEWLRHPQNGTAVVFVHGILSSGEACWRHANGTYWPDLLSGKPELNGLGLYVYSYQTGIFSGSYNLNDVVDDLKERLLNLDRVAEAARRLVFVCHSMGGIVVRKFLVERVADLLDRQIQVGLFLVASPSVGSDYANWLQPIAKLLGHTQADVLRFSQSNLWLNGLDKEFQNLKEAGRLKITGKELIEDTFVVLKTLLRKQVVPPFSGARYFGEPYKVPGSDHFSIAKPENAEAMQHRLLIDFIEKLPSAARVPGKAAVTAATETALPDTTVSLPASEVGGQTTAVTRDAFKAKVGAEVRRCLSASRPAASVLREALRDERPAHSSSTSVEDLLVPVSGEFSPETAIRTWRKTVKSCLGQRRDLAAEVKQIADDVLGWLVLLSVQASGIRCFSGTALYLDGAQEIVIPVQTPAGTEVFVSRLRERRARFQLLGNQVAGDRRVNPGELELGLLSADRLREIEALIYKQVFKTDPPPADDWLGDLRNTLRLRDEDDGDMYYVTLPRAHFSDDLELIRQLRTDLPHLKAFLIGTDGNGGDSILLLDESLLVALIREYLIMLRDFA